MARALITALLACWILCHASAGAPSVPSLAAPVDQTAHYWGRSLVVTGSLLNGAKQLMSAAGLALILTKSSRTYGPCLCVWMLVVGQMGSFAKPLYTDEVEPPLGGEPDADPADGGWADDKGLRSMCARKRISGSGCYTYATTNPILPPPTNSAYSTTTTTGGSAVTTSSTASLAATTSASTSMVAATTQSTSVAMSTSGASTSAASTTAAASTAAASTSSASVSVTTTSSAATWAASTSFSATTNAATTVAASNAATTSVAATTSAASTTTALASTGSTSQLATSTASTFSQSTSAVTTSTASTTASTLAASTLATQSTSLAAVTDSTATSTLGVTTSNFASSTTFASTSAASTSVAVTTAASTSTAALAATSTASTSARAVSTLSTSHAATSTTSVASTSAGSTTAAATTAASFAASTGDAAASTTAASTAATTSAASTNAAATSLSASTAAVSTSTAAVASATASSSTTFASTADASTLASTTASVSSTAVASSTASAQATSIASVSTTAAVLTSTLASTMTTGGLPLATAPSHQSGAFYYNASSFLLQTSHVSSASQNFLPLVQQDFAVVVLTSSMPLYVRPPDCSAGSCCNSTQVVAPCCTSSAAPGCVSATAPATCVDDQNAVYGSAAFGQSTFYQLGIVGACQNLLIKLEMINGDADLYARVGALPDALSERHPPAASSSDDYDWSSANPGSDSIMFCCGDNDGNTRTPFPGPASGSLSSYERSSRRTLHNIMGNNTGTGMLYLQVVAWNAKTMWRLSLTVGILGPSMPVVPLAQNYWMLDSTQVSCPGFPPCFSTPHSDFVGYSCWMLPIPSADSVDPYYAWLNQSVGSGLQPASLLPNQVAFTLRLSSSAAGQQLPPLLLDNCVINAPDILDSAGEVMFPSPVPLVAAPPLACDHASLAPPLAAFTAFAQGAGTPPVSQQTDVVQAVSAAVSSRAWAACYGYSSSLLSTAPTLSGRSAPNDTTVCVAARGTAEFLSDPCCNVLLLLTQCCAPRPVANLVYTANATAIEAQCRTPACSIEAANQFSLFLQLRSDPRVGCDAQTLQSTRFFGLAPNPISLSSGGACAKYLQWSGTTTPYDPALTDCVLQALESSSFLLTAFGSTVFNMSLASFPDQASFLAAFKTNFYARYDGRPVCQQPGAPFNSLGVQLRDRSLDANATACAAAMTCNWDFTRTNVSCLGQGYRNSSFCGYCNGGYCQDFSDPTGCSIRTDSYSGGLPAYCASIGGVLMAEEQVLGSKKGYTCYLPWATNQSQCFDPTQCLRVVYTNSPPSALCLPGCSMPSFNSSTCGCFPLPSDPLLALECNYLAWDPNRGHCWHLGIVTDGDCAARGGTWLGGQEWHPGYLNTPAACAAAGGTCVGAPMLDQASCQGSCNICPSCNQTTCEAMAVCNDVLSFPAAGACVSTPFLNRLLLAPSCPYPTYLTPIGCADVTIDAGACARNNLTWYTPAGSDLVQCEVAQACSEARNGLALPNSFRTGQECIDCGGLLYPAFTNITGTWTAYQWQPLSWMPRQYTAGSVYANAFDTALFSSDFDAVTGSLKFGVLKSHLLCEYSQPSHIMEQLACDCGGSASSAPCYSIQGTLVSLQRACSGHAVNLTTGNTELLVPATTSFAAGCAEVAFYSVSADPFVLPPTIRSSLFLASLAKGQRAIITSTKGAQVGQLAGDGMQISMESAAGVVLCLPLRTDLGAVDVAFVVPDFATCDASFDISSFTPMELSAWVDVVPSSSSTSVSRICAQLPATVSGTYFPIFRSAAPQAGFFSSLSSSQQAAFYAALVIYVALAVVTYYRVLSAIIYSFLVAPLGTIVAIWGMASLILTLRWVYFAIIISDSITRGSPADYVLSELPTTLFFSLFSLIVLFWAMLYHATVRVQGTDLRKPMLITFGVANTLLYLFLIAVIVVYVRTSGTTTVAFCGQAASSDVASTLAKVYKVTLSVIVLALGIAFLVYGIVLGRLLNKMRTSADARSKFRKLITVAIIFPLALILQCALLLYATWGPPISTSVALVLLILVEIVPLCVLAWNISLPPVFKNPFRDVVWCYHYKDGLLSTTTGSRSSSSRGEIVSGGNSVASFNEESRGVL